MKKYKILFLCFVLFAIGSKVSGQVALSNYPSAGSANDERKWAVNVMVGLTTPVITDNPQNVPVKNFGGDLSYEISGEYYLPYKWAVTGSFYRNEITYDLSEYGEGSRTETGFGLGAKKYFLSDLIPIQPYLSANVLFNLDDKNTLESLGVSNNAASFETKAVNLRAGAGFDVYLLSSLALTFDYRFYFSPGGSTSLTGYKNGAPFTVEDKGMYHNIAFGVKATFPFKVTSDDLSSVFDSLFSRY
jgi:hypothetical protein